MIGASALGLLRRWPLWVQVNLAMLLATMSITVLTGAIVKYKEIDYLLKSVEASAQQALSMLCATAIDAVISKDRPVLETVVSEAAKSNKNIDGIYIYDVDGNTLALWHANDSGLQRLARFKQDVVAADEKFGVIELAWSIESQEEEIEHHIASVQWIIVFSLILLSIVMTLVFHVLAVSPVNAIYQRLVRLADGNHSVKSSKDTSKEIGRLNDSVDTLSAVLAKQEIDARQQQENLENQVAARTSDLNRLYEQMKHQALHDALTGLPNRILLVDRLTHAISRVHRYGAEIAVFFIDLNRFKHVNDSYGHLVGDQLIKEVATRIRSCLRGEDTVARFAGDEFVCVLFDIKGRENAARVAEKIAAAVSKSVTLDGAIVQVEASIGITFCPEDSVDAEALLRHADIAMFQAKACSHKRYEFYREDIGEVSKRKANLETEIRSVVSSGQLKLVFQPIRHYAPNECVGFEALVRWDHPTLGMLSPDVFISLAEETGVIQEIDLWVLENACNQISEFNAQHGKTHMVSVNFSCKNFQSPDLLARIDTIFQRLTREPPKVQIEITENTYLDETETTMANIVKLKEYGFRLAIDDFGAGYASFSYLTRLPIDAVKIDKQFMARLNSDPTSKTIATAIINLGKKLGLTVIAEGVEDTGQEEFLLQHQCAAAQGYLYGRPHGVGDLFALLEYPLN